MVENNCLKICPPDIGEMLRRAWVNYLFRVKNNADKRHRSRLVTPRPRRKARLLDEIKPLTPS